MGPLRLIAIFKLVKAFVLVTLWPPYFTSSLVIPLKLSCSGLSRCTWTPTVAMCVPS